MRPVDAVIEELVHAEIGLRSIRVSRDAAVALLVDADGRLAQSKARVSGLRAELEALITQRVTHAAIPA